MLNAQQRTLVKDRKGWYRSAIDHAWPVHSGVTCQISGSHRSVSVYHGFSKDFCSTVSEAKLLRDRADHSRTIPYRVAHTTTCPVRAVVEQLVRAACPARAVAQHTHTRWIRQEQVVSVSKQPYSLMGACRDALSQTSLVRLTRLTHSERCVNDWRRKEKREDQRKSLTLGTKRKILFVVFDYNWWRRLTGQYKDCQTAVYPPLTGYSTYRIHLINWCISFHNCQILSPSETGVIVSAQRLPNITLLTLVATL